MTILCKFTVFYTTAVIIQLYYECKKLPYPVIRVRISWVKVITTPPATVSIPFWTEPEAVTPAGAFSTPHTILGFVVMGLLY